MYNEKYNCLYWGNKLRKRKISPPASKKMPVIDSSKIDGDELDLSLCELSSIPVKEIAARRKITKIDLSCNVLTSVPFDLFKLDYLVKIDLSKNKLTELPPNIGNLHKLQHLDLYSNQLTTLPSGISQLKSLKWLDLKDNPLEEDLTKVAGECLDENQCRKCAQNVIYFLKLRASAEERERQRLLKIEREKEAKREEVKKQEREMKKKMKEQKRKEYAAKLAQQKNEEDSVDGLNGTNNSPDVSLNETQDQVEPGSSKGLLVFMTLAVVIVAVCVGIYLFDESNQMKINAIFQKITKDISQTVNSYFNKSSS